MTVNSTGKNFLTLTLQKPMPKRHSDRLYDKNGDILVTAEKLKQVFCHAELGSGVKLGKLANEFVKNVFAWADSNRDGKITKKGRYLEFLKPVDSLISVLYTQNSLTIFLDE